MRRNIIELPGIVPRDEAGSQSVQARGGERRMQPESWNEIVAGFERMSDAPDILMPGQGAHPREP
jgi:hypothetical protein